MTEPTGNSGAREVAPGIGRRVAVRYALVNAAAFAGFYAVVPVLPLWLTGVTRATGWQVGLALLGFTLASRGSSILLTPMLRHAAIRSATSAGLGLAAVAFALLSFTRSPTPAIVLLVLAGLGISVNGLLGRIWIASVTTVPADRNSVYAVAQVLANVAAALAPFGGLVLLGLGRHGLVAQVVAGLYALAALTSWFAIPAQLHADAAAGPESVPSRSGLVRTVLADAQLRRLSAVAWASMFLYGQFFSAVALAIAEVTGSGLLRGGYFFVNAGLVVLLAAPITVWVNRRLQAGVGAGQVLRYGSLLFAAAFAVLAGAGSGIAVLFLVVAVFSVAESLVEPVLSTAFTDLPGQRSLVTVFTVRQLATATGEAAGALSGGWLFLTAHQHGADRVYWAAVAVAGAAVLLALRPPRSGSARLDAPIEQVRS